MANLKQVPIAAGNGGVAALALQPVQPPHRGLPVQVKKYSPQICCRRQVCIFSPQVVPGTGLGDQVRYCENQAVNSRFSPLKKCRLPKSPYIPAIQSSLKGVPKICHQQPHFIFSGEKDLSCLLVEIEGDFTILNPCSRRLWALKIRQLISCHKPRMSLFEKKTFVNTYMFFLEEIMIFSRLKGPYHGIEVSVLQYNDRSRDT